MWARKGRKEVMSSDSESETGEILGTSPRPREDEAGLSGYDTSQKLETDTGTEKARKELPLTPTSSSSVSGSEAVDANMIGPSSSSMVTPVLEEDIQDSDGDHSQVFKPKGGSTSSTVEKKRRNADQGPSLTQLDKNKKRKSKNYATGSQALIKRFENQFAKSAKSTKSFVTQSILESAKKRLQIRFDKIRDKSSAHHVWLQEELESAIQMLKDNSNNYKNIFQNLRRKMDTKIAESSKVRPIVKKQVLQEAHGSRQIQKEMAEQKVRKSPEKEREETGNRFRNGLLIPPSSSQTASSAEESEDKNATVTFVGMAPMTISVPEVVAQDLGNDANVFKSHKSSSPSLRKITEAKVYKGSSSSSFIELINLDEDEDQKDEPCKYASESQALINAVID